MVWYFFIGCLTVLGILVSLSAIVDAVEWIAVVLFAIGASFAAVWESSDVGGFFLWLMIMTFLFLFTSGIGYMTLKIVS